MERGAVILCGGKSKRMGTCKALLRFGAEAMLQRVVRLVSGVVPEKNVVVVASAGQDLPALPAGVEIAYDRQASRGPLEGLAVGLAALPAEVEAAYVTGCDVPLVLPEWIEHLFSQLTEHDLVVPAEKGRLHALAAVYRTRIEPTIEELLSKNALAMYGLVHACNALQIDIEQLRSVDPALVSLRNVNSPADLRAALQVAGLPENDSI